MQFLGTLAVRTAGSPRWVIGGIAVLLIASIFLSLRLQVSTDISSLMPQNSRLSASLLQALNDFGSTDRLILSVESLNAGVGSLAKKRQSLKTTADQIANSMAETGLFSSITYRLTEEDRAFFEELGYRYPFHYHSSESFSALESSLAPDDIEKRVSRLARFLRASPIGASAQPGLLRDPLGFRSGRIAGTASLTGFQLDLSDGYFFSPDGESILVLAKPAEPSQDTEFASMMLGRLEEIVAGLGGDGRLLTDYSMNIGQDFRVQLIGPYVETLYGSQAAAREILPSILVTCLGLLILFGLVYRSLAVLLVLAVPLFAGIALSSGMISLFTMHLTMISIGFATMLAGLGVDFEIHLMERFGQERAAGGSVSVSLFNAFATSGRGVLAGAFSTAAIFLLIATSDFGALREFGWIMGLGIMVVLAAVFILLPLLLSVFTGLARSSHKTANERWCRWVVGHAHLIVLLGLVVTVVLAVPASRLELKSNIYRLGPVNAAYEVGKEQLLRRVAGSTNLVMVLNDQDEFEALLETSERISDSLDVLRFSGKIGSFESLSSLLPSRQSQLDIQSNVGQWNLVAAMDRFDQSLQNAGFRAGAFEPFITSVLSYRLPGGHLVGLEDFKGTPAESLISRFLLQTNEGWRSLTYVYPPPGEWEEQVPPEIIESLEGVGEGVTVTGVVPIFEEISHYVRKEFLRLTLFALLAVLIISMLFFRRPTLSVLSVIPAILGLTWTLGLMQWLGVELNMVSMLVAPMILGLGVDDAMHVLNRYREQPGELPGALAAVSRGVLMTSATTIIGFGSLAFADLPSL
ncbi:MAG TPA: MMPL family transporter, partial [Xanthomonadales bacterium]|nr:MMPL family transporter [Xanthomonadales bacterium]